jgi:hypothetical protein
VKVQTISKISKILSRKEISLFLYLLQYYHFKDLKQALEEVKNNLPKDKVDDIQNLLEKLSLN